ncbi:MAG: hypothetical protein ACU0A2_05515 [Cognatishimia sp.]|jgi:hypothetical protein|uniref:hypothetical protein n=1 Tax=Cognatishimia sp. TaxID=2211648 RepID=UPI0040588231
MDKFSDFLSSVQRAFRQVTETGFVFLGFVVLVYLLLGEQSGGFVLSVIANISVMVNVLTPQVLGAVGLGLALLYLTKNRRE